MKPVNSQKHRPALKKAGVSVASKTFSTGGHGFGFNPSFAYHSQMLRDLTTWLNGLDDIIVGVESVQEGGQPSAAGCQWYSLDGQSVAAPRHGIFVGKDKKLVIK